MKILVLNSGSSSQKSALYEVGDHLPPDPPAPLWEGKIEWSGEDTKFQVKTSAGASEKGAINTPSRTEAGEYLLNTLWSGRTRALASSADIEVVGHRVVHGGPKYDAPTRLDAEVKSEIAKVSVFAPLHNRAELEGMAIIEKLLGPVPQVAVFDTGFHRTLPPHSSVYPGPYQWLENGIRRYGFHGINHQYCGDRAAQLLARDPSSLKIVTCHLGNGCSLAAIRAGKSVDTTMGFTPLEGLMMGTRSGSVDPGILTYLMREHQFEPQQIDDLLNNESGLLGISGVSGDMREIVSLMKQGHSRAKLAFDIFVHRLVAAIGGMVAVLQGVDALVFTAGIGENSPEVRKAVCQNLTFLGLNLDINANSQVSADSDIAESASAVRILVIRAQEDWAIAKDCARLIQKH